MTHMLRSSLTAFASGAVLLLSLSANADAQSFTCATIRSMNLQRSPAGTGTSHRLIVDHAAWSQCGLPAPSVELVFVDPGTTVVRGVAGRFGGCDSFPDGPTVFDFNVPTGGPFEIRLSLVGVGATWDCWSSFAVPVFGGSSAARPYGLDRYGANILQIGGTVTAGASSDLFVTGTQPHASGFYFISGSQSSVPYRGGTLLIGFQSSIALSASADSTGVHRLRVPVDASLTGQTFYLQAAFNDSAQPRGILLTHGLKVVP